MGDEMSALIKCSINILSETFFTKVTNHYIVACRKKMTILFLLFFPFMSFSACATDYHVGPEQEHSNLNSIPWSALGPGDVVNIHWRDQPYRSKIGLRGRGTADNRIIIRGILGPNGQRPIISGNNAVTPTDLQSFFNSQWDEHLAVILIKRQADGANKDEWGYKPGFITIENLRIEGGHERYSFTTGAGSTRNYSRGAGGIWAVLVENFIVRNCEITDNGNGLFVLSKNNNEEETSRNVLVESNYIHSNGTEGGWLEHNIYTQVSGITFQYNRLGTLRSGAVGSTLKDRSSNTVVRYNWIESSARAIDFVEPEDSHDILSQEPNFGDAYVYGNVIINDGLSGNMIHYGGDTGIYDWYRKGTLYFYNNTVMIRSMAAQMYRSRLFDVSTMEETVEMRNNIIHHIGDSNFMLMNELGVANFSGTNWITNTWQQGHESRFAGTINTVGTLLTGNAPGFTDALNNDFRLNIGSPAIGSAVALPASIVSKHPVNLMYQLHADNQPRTSLNDLGAFDSNEDGIAPLARPTPPAYLNIGISN
jgi:hypothetical protein